jgi:glucans biosynthesis protein
MLQNFSMYSFTARKIQAGLLLISLFLMSSVPALAFDFNDVAKKAKQLAASSYKEPPSIATSATNATMPTGVRLVCHSS